MGIKDIRKIKVMYLMEKYKGNNHLLNTMILGLDPERFDAQICYVYGSPDGSNLLDRYGISFYLEAQSNKKSMFSRVILLSKVLKNSNTEILHCHRHKAAVFGVLSGLLTGGVTVFSHVHGLRRSRTLCRRITNSFLSLKIAAFMAVSDAAKEDIIRTNWFIRPSKVKTVRNGIDIQHLDSCAVSKEQIKTELGLPIDALVFGTVGRLVPTKGHTYLLDAFALTRKKLPKAKLVIVGEGYLHNELKEKCAGLGLADSVIFPGQRADALGIMNGFDVFVFPSVAEGLPLALLEAMATRLPVIATEVGGIPEIINRDGFGTLVPPKNAHVLGYEMTQVGLLSVDKKKTMGDKARKRIEEGFTTAIMCNNIANIYESVLD